jgi:UDP-N-acetylmuramoylalanine--D-glutamate ligase
MRILGKGTTAKAIKEVYKDAILFDDCDQSIYDINSDELTVVSPGIPPSNYLVKNTKNLISDYDLFLSSKYNEKVNEDELPLKIWISGTNGKTTTTQMLQCLFEDKQSQVGGNIGTALASLDSNKKIWLLETSSYTLHYNTIAKANIYVLLPVSEDHLSWHGSMHEYEKAKLSPLDSLEEGEIALIPTKYKEYKTNGHKICYDGIEDLEKEFGISKEKINFKEPFLMDAVLALAVEKILFDTMSYDKINNFKTDVHKLEEFKDKKNRTWVNDSKATNVDATIQALKTYQDKIIFLILGGDDKDADLKPLFEEIKKYKVRLFLIGKNRDKFINMCNYYALSYEDSIDIEVAIKSISISYQDVNNEISLLSPACASFDQFDSFPVRGNKFKEIVNNL